MARRLFNGRQFSENGWPYVDDAGCTWDNIPGTNGTVQLQIQSGPAFYILRALAADYNAHVEPLYNNDCACWTLDNKVSTSNHPGGTACDLRWNSHPFQKRGTFTPAQLRTIQELLDFYEGMVFWAGVDWDQGGWGSPIDEMHWQLGYGTYDQSADRPFQKVFDFIARKIRADGFSTFRRGNTVALDDPIRVLADATGLTMGRAAQILPTMSDGLRQAECTTPNRIAMFIAQTGHESANFNATEEYASGAAYEGRTDLGNTQPGDGVRFKGRTWIQITGRSHYAEFSQWAFDRGLVPTSTYFVDHPTELADLKWAGIGAAWYWTISRPMNALIDAGENAQWGAYRGFAAVTAAINGGTTGIDERRTRYSKALSVGDRLLALTQNGDDMAQVPQDQWDRVFREQTQKLPSRSPLRHLGEGVIDTWAGIDLNQDGNLHVLLVKFLAELGDEGSIDLLREVANADPVRYPDRQKDAKLALLILVDIEANKPTALKSYLTQKGVA